MWAIEDGILGQLSGDAASERVQSIIFDYLPTRERAMEMAVSIRSFREFISGTGFCFVPAHLQSHFKVILGLLVAVEADNAHEVSIGNQVTVVVQAWERIGYFMRWGKFQHAKAGSEAMKDMIEELTKIKDKKGADCDEFKEAFKLLNRFRWLVPANMEAAVKDLGAEKKKKGGKGKKKAVVDGAEEGTGAASSSSCSAAAMSKISVADQEEADKAAISIFGG